MKVKSNGASVEGQI